MTMLNLILIYGLILINLISKIQEIKKLWYQKVYKKNIYLLLIIVVKV